MADFGGDLTENWAGKMYSCHLNALSRCVCGQAATPQEIPSRRGFYWGRAPFPEGEIISDSGMS